MSGFPKAGDEYGGRYRIVRQLGHGGMGIVYEAVDKVLNRSVALKIVLPSLPDREDFTARFAREASVLARIRSRNIVQIHEYGEDGDTVFFVTELFPDGDLQTWLATHGPLDRRAALSLVAQVGEALADAHATGVIHRDVKPGNVLLWSRPEGLIPYLCDFGIAIDTPGDGATRASLTRTGTLIGSPAYMAPERHFGHAADERGDVYSLGCLLWSVLTGDAPYTGTDFQMMNAHINAAVPALGTGHPVDDRIDAVLAGALSKDPERRTPSPSAMRADLLAIIRDIDAAVVPPPIAPVPPAPASDPAPAASPAPAPAPESDDHDHGHTRATSIPLAAPPVPAPRVEHHTVIRDLPVPPPPAPPAPPRGAADAHPTPEGRRRWLPAALVAAGVVVAIGATAAVVAANGGDERPTAAAPSAAPSTGSSASVSSPSADAVSLTTPRPPRVTARPGYRSVAFRLAPPPAPRVDGVTQRIEFDAGQGWQESAPAVRVSTREGGAQGCLKARTVLSNAAGDEQASKTVRTCGKSAARTVRLVRTADACSAGAGCRWYNVYVSGFASGSNPQALIYDSSGSPWCDCTFRKVKVGANGRGAQIHEWQVTPGRFNGYVTLVVDGVGQRVFVP